MSKVIELKVGNQSIPFEFSMSEFTAQYAKANRKQFDPNVLAEDALYYKEYRMGEASLAPCMQSMFIEDGQVNKTKKGIFSKKQVADPCRHFLLFKDEELREIPAPDSDLSRRSGGMWPLLHDDYANTLLYAGKIYTTGKRLILDAYYSETSAPFMSLQLFGKINLESCAQKFNIPYFTLKKFAKSTLAKTEWTPFNTAKIETDLLVNPENNYTKISYVLVSPEGEKGLQMVHRIPGVSDILTKEIENLKPINLEGILATWQFAANNSYMQATPLGMFPEKKKVSLKV